MIQISWFFLKLQYFSKNPKVLRTSPECLLGFVSSQKGCWMLGKKENRTTSSWLQAEQTKNHNKSQPNISALCLALGLGLDGFGVWCSKRVRMIITLQHYAPIASRPTATKRLHVQSSSPLRFGILSKRFTVGQT